MKSKSILALLALVAACRTPDPAYYTSDGRTLKDVQPLSYRIAVAPVDKSSALADPDGSEDAKLKFAYSDRELHKQLVLSLRGLRASSEVVGVRSTDAKVLRRAQADLLVVPRLTEKPLLEKAGKKRVFLTSLLWFTTWYGGLRVDDKVYDAKIAMDFDVINALTGDLVVSVPASSNQVELSFLDRQKGGGRAQSLVVPPYWTKDNTEKTSESLSERMTKRLAGDLTRYFKEDFVRRHRDTMGELRLSSPRNRTDVGAEAHVAGVVVGLEPITSFAIYLNGGDEPIVDQTVESLPNDAEQRRGGVYEVRFDERMALRPGRNRIQFELGVGGRLSARTIVVYNGKAVPKAVSAAEPRTGSSGASGSES